MLSKKAFLKFGFRFLVVLLIFFSVKMTIAHSDGYLFAPVSIFYFTSAFILVMFTWEINDWLIKKQLKTPRGLDFSGSIKILGVTFAFLAPLAALLYYLGLYVLDDICQIPTNNRALQFRTDWMRAMLLGISIIVSNLFYFSVKQKNSLEQKMIALQNEVMTSKYTSLKNQISPHFLFNSFNTLTSLMYEDRDLASDFISRLATSYRYILENKEEELVSLEKELSFLDSFIFMMNVRHEDALQIETKIGLDAAQYVIPTLSLQMLVENALKHNFYSKEKPMTVQVYSVGKLGLVVENTLRKRDDLGETTKIGLKNIQKRYAFYTHQEVTIEQDEHTFKVTMPLLPLTALDKNVRAIS